MKAGRELDALVAEKVMGHGSRWNFMPSTDLDDAWKVVQQVLTWKHGHVDLSIESGGGVHMLRQKDSLKSRVCENCAKTFQPARDHQRFCSSSCRALKWREANRKTK